MKLLVFGGTGFLGSHVSMALSEKHELHLVRRGSLQKISPLTVAKDKITWVPWETWQALDFSQYDAIVSVIGRSHSSLTEEEINQANFELPIAIQRHAIRTGAKQAV